MDCLNYKARLMLTARTHTLMALTLRLFFHTGHLDVGACQCMGLQGGRLGYWMSPELVQREEVCYWYILRPKRCLVGLPRAPRMAVNSHRGRLKDSRIYPPCRHSPQAFKSELATPE